MIVRRTFIAGASSLAGSAFAGPLLSAKSVFAAAQEPNTIGVLASASPSQWTRRIAAFKDGLKSQGYEEGRNLAIEYRWSENRNERLPELAADLARLGVRVIAVLGNTTSALAAKAASGDIPVVFRIAANPVDVGLVASLSRPGGKVTGVTTLGSDLGSKHVELLHEVVPTARLLALFVNRANPVLADGLIKSAGQTIAARGLRYDVVSASRAEELEQAFRALRSMRADGLIIGADTFLNIQNGKMAELAVRDGLPTISPYREFVEAGGLMSYGGSIATASQQAGVYVGRILAGAQPATLPVQQVAAVELLLNMKAAKAMGLKVPVSVAARADEVID